MTTRIDFVIHEENDREVIKSTTVVEVSSYDNAKKWVETFVNVLKDEGETYYDGKRL